MAKHYLQIIAFFICLLVTTLSYSQTSGSATSTNNTIEGLHIYPNPVSNGKLYISSSNNLSKHIEIYDVLGKKVYATLLIGKAMDISRFNKGVYIIKIMEANRVETRKLVVK